MSKQSFYVFSAPGSDVAQPSVQPPAAPPPRLAGRREGMKKTWINSKTQEYRDFQRECHAMPGCKACGEGLAGNSYSKASWASRVDWLRQRQVVAHPVPDDKLRVVKRRVA
eukprot:3696079-Heterocapsa_arctica.AAC.1